MAASVYYHGLTLRWATNGVSCTAFGAQALIQSTDNERQLSEVTIPDQNGNTAIWVGYDPRKSATFEYVPASNSTPASGSLAITKPTIGNMITVGDSVDATSDLSGSTWIVQSVVEKRMSTDAAKVTVRAISFDGITG